MFPQTVHNVWHYLFLFQVLKVLNRVSRVTSGGVRVAIIVFCPLGNENSAKGKFMRGTSCVCVVFLRGTYSLGQNVLGHSAAPVYTRLLYATGRQVQTSNFKRENSCLTLPKMPLGKHQNLFFRAMPRAYLRNDVDGKHLTKVVYVSFNTQCSTLQRNCFRV